MARYIDADNIRLKGIPVFDQNLEVLIPLSDVRKALQMTPTADVQEVRHGRWLSPQSKGCLSYDESAYKECSECGKVTFLAKTKNSQMNYCPNCGAKMDGKEQRNGQRETD